MEPREPVVGLQYHSPVTRPGAPAMLVYFAGAVAGGITGLVLASLIDWLVYQRASFLDGASIDVGVVALLMIWLAVISAAAFILAVLFRLACQRPVRWRWRLVALLGIINGFAGVVIFASGAIVEDKILDHDFWVFAWTVNIALPIVMGIIARDAGDHGVG